MILDADGSIAWEAYESGIGVPAETIGFTELSPDDRGLWERIELASRKPLLDRVTALEALAAAVLGRFRDAGDELQATASPAEFAAWFDQAGIQIPQGVQR